MLMEIRSESNSFMSELSAQATLGSVKTALEDEVRLFDRREKWLADFKVSSVHFYLYRPSDETLNRGPISMA